jgi:redox-sensitive bicupin YhaK (pirin superfamily)
MQHRGYRKLRVINEDFIAPGKGFETHPHINMEILTYVMKGSVAHKDSLGNGSTIRPNEVRGIFFNNPASCCTHTWGLCYNTVPD